MSFRSHWTWLRGTAKPDVVTKHTSECLIRHPIRVGNYKRGHFVIQREDYQNTACFKHRSETSKMYRVNDLWYIWSSSPQMIWTHPYDMKINRPAKAQSTWGAQLHYMLLAQIAVSVIVWLCCNGLWQGRAAWAFDLLVGGICVWTEGTVRGKEVSEAGRVIDFTQLSE